MYVDPQAQAFLDSIPDADGAADVQAQRVAFSELWRSLAPEVGEPCEVASIEVGGAVGPLEALCYRPADCDEPLPTLLFLHGGGCVTLRPGDFDATSRILACAARCDVVVPAYRQAPEDPFPAPLDDAVAVYRSLVNGDAPIIDNGQIAVAGDSAGGYLAAALCIDARDHGLPQPQVQILLYPMLDMASKSPSRVSRDFFINDDALAGVIDLHCGDALLDPRASPLRAADLSGLARAVVITTDLDPLEDEAIAYVERLRAAGNRASHFCYQGQIHGFFSFGGIMDEGNDAVEHVAALLRSSWQSPTRRKTA